MRLVLLCAALAVLAISCQRTPVESRIGSDGRDFLTVDSLAAQFKPRQGTPGGSITLSMQTEPGTFNPLLASGPAAEDMRGLLFEGLLGIDPLTGDVAPRLAQTWEESDSGATITFRLRAGLRWSDSVALTAYDVAYTIDSVVAPNINVVEGAAALLRTCGVPSVTVLDSQTVRVGFGRYQALAGRAMTLPILPEHVARGRLARQSFDRFYATQTFPESLVVSGPYRLGVFVPTQRVVLARNPRWHGSGRQPGTASLDSVVFSFTPDENTRKVRFLHGELDFYTARGADYAMLAQDSTRRFHVYCLGPSRTATALLLNPLDSTLADTAVRAAISHAVDRDGLMNAAGVSGFAQYSPISPLDTALAPGALRPASRFDTLHARSLLSAAGYTDRNGDGVLEGRDGKALVLRVLVAGGNLVRVKTATRLCADLARIGISASEVTVAPDSMSAALAGAGSWQAAIAGIGSSRELFEYRDIWHSTGSTHPWKQAGGPLRWQVVVDSLLDLACSQRDVAVRSSLYQQTAAAVVQSRAVVFLFAPERIVCLDTRFANVNPTLAGGVLHNLPELFVDQSSP